MKAISLVLLITVTSLMERHSQAAVIDDWRIRYPQPYNASLFNAAHGNGVYVMVGAGGVIVTSPDLFTWQTVHHPELLENVVFGNGQFIASGFKGDILSSPDGTNWTTHASGTSLSLTGIEYSNGLYVAAGEQGVTAVSSNGVHWSISSAGNTNYWYKSVTYGSGQFAAAATHGDFDGSIKIVTSTNGVNWSESTLPGGLPAYTELWSIGYGGGRFTAVGYWEDYDPYVYGVLILTSTDGINWARVIDAGIPEDDNQWVLWSLEHDGSQWVGVGENGLVMTSANGLNWTTLPLPLGNAPDFYGVTLGPGGTTVPVGRRGDVYSTSDFSTWTRNWTGSYVEFLTIAFNGSQYLAGRNSGTVHTSEDGTDWTYRFTGGLSGRITGAAHGMGRWVISSDSNAGGPHHPLSTSTNGIDWIIPTTSAGFDDCRGVAFGNDIFVAIPETGSNTLAYSTNGLHWTETTHPWFTAVQDKNYLAFGDGKFVSWGDSNSTVSVAVSADGMVWQTYNTGIATPTPIAGAYGNGRWVLVGSNGRVMTSTDLMNWSEQTIQFDGSTYLLRGVAYGNGQWVIVGNEQHIWSSPDGVNWHGAFTTQLTGTSWYFADVAHDGSSFWTVGGQGAIYQSLPFSTLLPPTLAIQSTGNPSLVKLLIGGSAGEMWNLDHKTSLTNSSWNYLTTITLTNDNHVHTHSLSGDPQGFYRLSEP